MIGQITNSSDEFDEFEEESVAERLWGLTEMFPDPVRNAMSSVVNCTTSTTSTLYKWSRTGLWVVGTSFTVLVLPIICEQQLADLQEQQAAQQRELLLGPSAAVSSPTAPPVLLPPGGGGGSTPFGLSK